jgi:hypothetical protein
MEETQKPTIDPESPVSNRKAVKRIPKYEGRDYQRMYYVMKKYRTLQTELLDEDEWDDPDPFIPTYIFYCFTGSMED